MQNEQLHSLLTGALREALEVQNDCITSDDGLFRHRDDIYYDLKVIDGDKIFNGDNTGSISEIYSSVIESLGIESVYNACIRHDIAYGQHLAVNDNRDEHNYNTKRINGYYLITGMNSENKTRILNEIIAHLGFRERITVEFTINVKTDNGIVSLNLEIQ